ncbi:MAG TPA: DUF374 domain-containing protein [Candidatus Melainabacteria bacterium]|nr:DUF374 domain-containing protein [Candidatus Melainabacteria bacterium]
MKIRLRDIFLKYPVLDGFRRSVLVGVCKTGTLFSTSTYPNTFFYPAESRPYLDNLWQEFGTAESKDEDQSKPAIFAIYHGRMVGLPSLRPNNKLTILISNSRDGEIIARALKEIGFSTARGSPAHGGVRGALEMKTAAKANSRLAMMVDGPRGPRYQVKQGLVRLAEITGLPIIPLVTHTRHNYWMDSWDNFMAPWWGTPMVHIFGHPIDIPRGITAEQSEQLTELLQSRMDRMREMAASFFVDAEKYNYKT